MLSIIVAMQNEADELLSRAHISEERTLYGKKIYAGNAFGKDFYLVLSGVGKTNAAASAMLAAAKFGADRLLNFGLAGGISARTDIAAVFRVSRAVQYDFDLSEVNGTQKGTLNEYPGPYFPLACANTVFPRATLATGDKLTSSLADIPLLNELGADVRDMEGAAIAHVAHFTGTPFSAYKAVSNKIGAESVTQYRQFTQRALAALGENMEKIFGELDG